jgi:hypothetical protein
MQKWEYVSISNPTHGIEVAPGDENPPTIEILNALGGQGWELVSVANYEPDWLIYLLKRPKP